MKWITPQNPFDSHKATFEGTVFGDRIEAVLGTCGVIAALRE